MSRADDLQAALNVGNYRQQLAAIPDLLAVVRAAQALADEERSREFPPPELAAFDAALAAFEAGGKS